MTKKHIITKLEARKLFSLEEDDLSPNDKPYTESDFNEFVTNVAGKTLWEYSKWRFPDSPKLQFKIALKILK